MSLRTLAVLLALAGVLLSFTALGGVGGLLVLLTYLIAASHSYLPLAHRNTTDTLAAHWLALGMLLLLLGVGMIGAIQLVPGIRADTAGTRLSILPEQAARWAIMAIVLGAINQIASELRTDQRRITGLLPFWLVAFSLIGSVLLLAGIGLVQVYVERLLSLGYPIVTGDRETLLAPLYTLWAIAAALLPIGLIIYGFLFLLRHPQRGSTVNLSQN